ncbi:MAG: helix-turn-helix domain-containing protein [Acidobacteriota bacterium]
MWALHLPATEKLVLLKLADCSDDEGGNAWPSVATLGRACGDLSMRGVHKVLVKLKARGYLQVQERAGRRHKSVTYRITIPDQPVNPRTPVNSSSQVPSSSMAYEPQGRRPSEPEFTAPLNPSSPDPSLIRPFEPSTTAAANPKQQSASPVDEFKKSFLNLYHRHRAGATYHWTKRDSANAHGLLAVYPYDDLVAMSEILLTLPSNADAWVGESDRSTSVLSHRASFLSNALAAQTRHPDAWTRVLERLETKLSTWDFRKWFGSTKQWKISPDGLTLFVAVDGQLHQRWIQDHYHEHVAAAAAEAAIPQNFVIFAADPRRPKDSHPRDDED